MCVVLATGRSARFPSDGVTQKGRQSGDWKCLSKGVGGGRRQIRAVLTLRPDGDAK